MQIKDRVFIVTGASSGIGLSTAEALSERGAKVALLARSTDALKGLAQQLPGSLPVTVDMTQFDRVKEAVGALHKHYGRVDGLINNAARSYAASVEEIDPALFDEIFHLNVLGPIVAMQAVITLMRAHGGGSIVNINSGTAFMTVPQYSVYSSSKRALLGFSLTARAELEKDHIVVCEIYPFITATNFGKNRMEIRSPADRRPITPRAISRSSWPVLCCKRSKKVRRSTSRMNGSAKWPGPPRKFSPSRGTSIVKSAY
jgi:short-subunit dehydrogenase